jgi:hypothetical protein
MTPGSPRFFRFARACCAAGLALAGTASPALTITFDYTYDTSGFFSGANAGRRDVLEQAAAAYASRITDSLAAIAPSGGNSWQATFANPSNPAATVSLSNLSVAADTIVIYVGAASLGPGVLTQAAPGGYTSNGNSTWLNNVAARGQTGALGSTPTDFGPWGGAISFNAGAAWHFDPSPATVEPFPGQHDFYTAALRGVGQVLGLGTAGSWFSDISGASFAGASVVATQGAAVPLDAGKAHWSTGTLSTVVGTGLVQEALLTPGLATDERRYLTALDLAGLQDVGWAVVPEAPALAWSAVLGVLGVWRWRRTRKN